MLQRHGGPPLYRQVETELQRRIDHGELHPGQRLPTDTALADQLAVNRLTVRAAIAELARAGKLYTRQGVGTFVTETRAGAEITIDPHEPAVGTDIMRCAEDAAPLEETVLGTAIGDPPNARHYLHVRAPIRRVDTLTRQAAQPWLTSSYWLSDKRFPDLPSALIEHGSPFTTLLEHYAVALRYAWRSFAAGAATAADAALLDVPTGSPLLLREGLNLDQDGQPVVYVQRRCRSDRIHFVLQYEPK